jgi:plasmid maintenance system antidote protein VapI
MLDPKARKALAQKRVSEVLEELVNAGSSQRTIGSILGVPDQYLSDYKQGRRYVSDVMARRFEQAFGINAQWLLVESDIKEAPTRSKPLPATDAVAYNLRVFSHPIEGDPQEHPKWEGIFAEVIGAAAAKLMLAKHPYLLRFGADDVQGRVVTGDLLLMSQATLPLIAEMESVIQVIRHGRGLYLARRKKNAWHRLSSANSEPISEDCSVHGHAMGIVWGSLT